MQKLYLARTSTTPEIHFSPEENIFYIRGTSSPEDVRAMYYPVIEWIKQFIAYIKDSDSKYFSSGSPLTFTVELIYFNSSSAKFLHDIILELKSLSQLNIPVIIEWVYENEDLDMKEAGVDISQLLDMDFIYTQKTVND
jgi:hypothetical protein